MDAKYRQGCQVAETAAAPLSVLGRVSSARRGWERGAEGRQGRVIDRGWKGWRYDAPGDVIARYNPLELPAGALSFTTPSLVCCLALCAIHLIPSPLSNQRGLSYPSLLLLLLLATIFSLWLALLFSALLNSRYAAVRRVSLFLSSFSFVSFRRSSCNEEYSRGGDEKRRARIISNMEREDGIEIDQSPLPTHCSNLLRATVLSSILITPLVSGSAPSLKGK